MRWRILGVYALFLRPVCLADIIPASSVLLHKVLPAAPAVLSSAPRSHGSPSVWAHWVKPVNSLCSCTPFYSSLTLLRMVNQGIFHRPSRKKRKKNKRMQEAVGLITLCLFIHGSVMRMVVTQFINGSLPCFFPSTMYI